MSEEQPLPRATARHSSLRSAERLRRLVHRHRPDYLRERRLLHRVELGLRPLVLLAHLDLVLGGLLVAALALALLLVADEAHAGPLVVEFFPRVFFRLGRAIDRRRQRLEVVLAAAVAVPLLGRVAAGDPFGAPAPPAVGADRLQP